MSRDERLELAKLAFPLGARLVFPSPRPCAKLVGERMHGDAPILERDCEGRSARGRAARATPLRGEGKCDCRQALLAGDVEIGELLSEHRFLQDVQPGALRRARRAVA